MKTENVVAVVPSTTVVVEITQDELDLIMKKREKDAHAAKQQAYIAEMNSLLTRARKDGFTFATKNRDTLYMAQVWGDAAGNWIKVG